MVLSDDTVRRIEALLDLGYKPTTIAREFGIRRETVSLIRNRHTHAKLAPMPKNRVQTVEVEGREFRESRISPKYARVAERLQGMAAKAKADAPARPVGDPELELAAAHAELQRANSAMWIAAWNHAPGSPEHRAALRAYRAAER